MKWVMSFGSRSRAIYRKNGVLGRSENAGRTLERDYVRRKVGPLRKRITKKIKPMEERKRMRMRMRMK